MGLSWHKYNARTVYELCIVVGEKCDVIANVNDNILNCEGNCSLYSHVILFKLMQSSELDPCKFFPRGQDM